MTNTHIRSAADVAGMISEGRVLLLAGDDALLSKLPPGQWIGGSSVNFMSEGGGTTDFEHILVTDITDYAKAVRIREYGMTELSRIGLDYPEHGFSVIIVPGLSPVHNAFAKEVQTYDGIFNVPLIGWVSGVHLSEIGRKAPKVFAGDDHAITDKVCVMHVTLPDHLAAQIDIINLFTQGDGPVITFEEEGFANESPCLIDGKTANLADYMTRHALDTQLPLVADYNGAMINVSVQAVDAEAGEVKFYAPVFRGVEYRFAKPFEDYIKAFDAHISGRAIGQVAFSCNCILNYVYAELEGKKTHAFVGPVTFGEIAYVLLNQTLAYLTVTPVT